MEKNTTEESNYSINRVKYIVVTGGVLSGLGKGVITSSLGRILRSHGLRVTAIKIDPYINVDAGTMSPFEHGEVFVLDDGGEVDLDLGNYERFIDIRLNKENNITTGKIYKSVIEKERKGKYLGKTVQVIPHICDEIQNWILTVANKPSDNLDGPPDVCVIELGGTVGDIESMPFIEALRQYQFRVGKENMCFVHVSLVPIIGQEHKTKPTQSSIRELRALGISPDMIMCRSERAMSKETKEKIANFCHVSLDSVIDVYNVSNLYRVPKLLTSQNVYNILCRTIGLNSNLESNLDEWSVVADIMDELNKDEDPIHIAMVGKYTGLTDSYHSVIKAIQHASFYVKKRVEIDWIDACTLESTDNEKYNESWEKVKNAHGILVPGGFGDRGIEGKILAAQYARENNKPYLGICLGMQVAVIECARNLLGLKNANSTEFAPKTEHPIVIFMPEISKTHMGGTMRLGKRRTFFSTKECLAYQVYSKFINEKKFKYIDERHRHRYEINSQYIDDLTKCGLSFVGQDETGVRQEIIEISDHPYYIGVQYHPEFYTWPDKPSPVFVGLLMASMGKLEEWLHNKN